MMKTKLFKRTVCLLGALLLTLSLSLTAFAADDSNIRYTNPDTQYQVQIIDDEDLLSPIEEDMLADKMGSLTAYGHIVFWSTQDYTYNDIRQAKDKRAALYGSQSAAILVINMNTHLVTIQAGGGMDSTVTSSYARSITDNVSGYASAKDYYTCAYEAMDQIERVMQGNRIAEPMKYISFVVIGLMLAFIVIVGVVFSKRRNPLVKTSDETVHLIGSGELKAKSPQCVRSEPSGWIRAASIVAEIAIFALDASGGGRGGSSGGSGGSGGSSRF